MVATGLAASTLAPLFQNQTELQKSEFDSLPRHHPRRKSDAKEGLITSSCQPETVGPTSDFSRTVTPSVCETLRPVCVTLRAFPKTNKTNIKPSIKPVHKMHKTVKTGRISKETLIDFGYYYTGFIGFMCFVGWFYKRFYDGFMVLCRGSQLRTINKQNAKRTTS